LTHRKAVAESKVEMEIALKELQKVDEETPDKARHLHMMLN
jgi:hypothetical protein